MNLIQDIIIPINGESVFGDLILEEKSSGIVLFADGSGGSRYSPRQRFILDKLNGAGFSTLFLDLLTLEESMVDEVTLQYRFNVPLLTARLEGVVDWARRDTRTKDRKLGLFARSTGAASCLVAASRGKESISAVVSQGGRTDLANEILPGITAATLFIVGGDDTEFLEINLESFDLVTCADKKLEIVSGASHSFEEPGKLDEVAALAVHWFGRYLE